MQDQQAMSLDTMMPNSLPLSEGTQQCDVLVIGGGPAGTTISTLLAQRGHKVTLLEKAHHPRFHIGESLLPANLPLLEKLGVAEQVRAIGMQKWGAEFVSPWHDNQSQIFEFSDAWDKSMPFAFQVRRSAFDEILIRNAEKNGVMVHEGCQAKEVEFLPDGVKVIAQLDDGASAVWHAKYLVDASGRDTFLGNRFKIKHRNPKHNSSALYAHFANAKRLPGKEEGHITIFWFEHGWFWFIPLADGTTSVGATVWPYYLKTRNKPLNAFFADTIALCPPLAERLMNAERVSEVEATGNFSYVCERTYGPNYMMLGDAFAFIDPVFSSGVMLAMQGGFMGAEAVDTCLREPAKASAALHRFDKMMRRGPKEFSWFIYRVTNPTMRDMFMAPRNVLGVKTALLSMLAGDIFGKTPIWPSIWCWKGIFYLVSLRHLKRTLEALKRRKRNIQVVDDPNLPTSA